MVTRAGAKSLGNRDKMVNLRNEEMNGEFMK